MINLRFDLRCVQPQWANTDFNPNHRPPIYRIYINDELITERTWRFDNETFVMEDLWLSAVTGQVYNLIVETKIMDAKSAEFSLTNFTSLSNTVEARQLNPTSFELVFG